MNEKTATFDLKDYRQPLVTSLGVMLGFLIGFLGQWVTEDAFALSSVGDYVAFFGSFFGVLLLLISLFRMLMPVLDRANTLRYYKNTLFMYMTGVLFAFGGLLLSAFV
jgi:hypothetical protein